MQKIAAKDNVVTDKLLCTLSQQSMDKMFCSRLLYANIMKSMSSGKQHSRRQHKTRDTCGFYLVQLGYLPNWLLEL